MNTKYQNKPFYDELTVVTSIPDIPSDVNKPSEGSILFVKGSELPFKEITVGPELNSTGKEAVIFHTKAVSGGRPLLAKIYRRTSDRVKAKNILLLSGSPHVEEICWPEAWLSDSPKAGGRCIGILMPQVPVVFQHLGEFLVGLSAEKRLCAANALVRNFKVLHEHHIQPADFNMNNFLVWEDRNGLKIYFIDTDSYQVENFPCPVAAPERIFDHPLRIEQGFCDYTSELRRPYEMAYGICVLLFRVLINDYPYDMVRMEPWQDFNDPENILNGNFLFRHDRGTDDDTTELWNACPGRLRNFFKSVFDADGFLFYKRKRGFSMEDIVRIFNCI